MLQTIVVLVLGTLCLPTAVADGQHVRRILRSGPGVLPANFGRQLQQAPSSLNCGNSPSCLAACFVSGTCSGGGAQCILDEPTRAGAMGPVRCARATRFVLRYA